MKFLKNNQAANKAEWSTRQFEMNSRGVELVVKIQRFLQQNQIVNDESFKEYLALFSEFTKFQNEAKLLSPHTRANNT